MTTPTPDPLHDACRNLIQQIDATHPPALTEALATDFAAASLADPDAALNGLRAALGQAADLRAMAALTQTAADPLSQLIRRLSDLNDQGQRATASAELDAALGAADAMTRAALSELALPQDRIANTPATTAKRLLADLRGQAHPGGLFRALHAAWEEWFDRGHDNGLTFDLTVALALARANLDRCKGVQRVQAMADLGITQYRLGQREGRADRLKNAVATFRAFLAETPRKSDPDTWAVGMVNLATVLIALAPLDPAGGHLTEAATCLTKALQVQTAAHAPDDHAATSALLHGLPTA